MAANWVDIVVVVFLIRGAYVGYKEGLSVELVKLGTVFSTYYFAISYYSNFAIWIAGHTRLALSWATVVAFLTIAVSSLVLVWLLFKVLAKIVVLQFASQISTAGGVLVGISRALLISALFLFAIFFVPNNYVKRQIYTNSWFGHRAIDASPKLYRQFAQHIAAAQQSAKMINTHFDAEKKNFEEALKVPGKKVPGEAGATDTGKSLEKITAAPDRISTEKPEQAMKPQVKDGFDTIQEMADEQRAQTKKAQGLIGNMLGQEKPKARPVIELPESSAGSQAVEQAAASTDE